MANFIWSDDPQLPARILGLDVGPGANETVEAFLWMNATKREYRAILMVCGHLTAGDCGKIDSIGNDGNRIDQTEGADFLIFLFTCRVHARRTALATAPCARCQNTRFFLRENASAAGPNMPRGAITSGFLAFALIHPACTLGISQSP